MPHILDVLRAPRVVRAAVVLACLFGQAVSAPAAVRAERLVEEDVAPLRPEYDVGYSAVAEPSHIVRLDVVEDLSAGLSLPQIKHIEARASALLVETAAELNRVLRYRPSKPLVLRVVSEAQYREAVGAVSWSSALFLNGEIQIAVGKSRRLTTSRLRRSLRHEYVHAAVQELSGARCPVWFEEGLAQLIEGPVNKVLVTALRARLQQGGPLALDLLDEGFWLLGVETVRAAYAQSVFAVRSLVNRFGFSAVQSYFDWLRVGETPAQAFSAAFGVELGSFEEQLGEQLLRWERSGAGL